MALQDLIQVNYLGKRVRFTAYVKSAQLTRWGGIYMAVKGPMERPGEQRKPLRTDNMTDRPVKGTTGWTRYEVVLDVVEGADIISMGFQLSGGGTLWMSRPTFEVVGLDVPVTRAAYGMPVDLPKEPQLDLATQ